ncbi:long-chain fatty acid--CoA ligase [Amycolatopsis rhabdoformis]|uniref:Long-chain fatty acid--CoA ligase n=1 Tax=Amycolatopsis rhabdoformis TaxID=1448059 RepID=A0ABZ1IFS5_9PSEU|nr:long-chain fatty acid--CoA ligase [Amycolatopsis rhabdoformis]WSE32508.1 long-chain fatty acid--CoA ligase [Amycolatopsis rhabdoformis]
MTSRPWEALYPDGALAALDVEGRDLADLLAASVREFGAAPALTAGGSSWSFEQVGDAVQNVARLLAWAGLTDGDRVAIMLPNSPEYVLGLFGTWTAGGVVVQVNPRYVRYEVDRILADSGARFLLTTAEIADRLGALDWPGRIFLADDLESAVDEALGLAMVSPPGPAAASRAGEPAVIQYTGGTTGAPKGVTLTHTNILANIEQRLRLTFGTIAVPAAAKVVNVLPMSHVYGLTCVTLMAIRTGMNQILLPKFDVRRVLETLRDERPFAFFGVPTMYTAFLRQEDLADHGVSAVSVFNSAGAGLPASQAAEFERRTGARIVDGFGISEASPTTHTNPLYLERRPGSAGIPVPFTDVKIVANADDPTPLPIGEVGELAVSGPQVMRGYWGQPELTGEVLRDGWLMTGDLARVDEDGFVYVVGRRKDVIIASGLNIYPAEVEHAIGTFPGVADVAVVGIPDDYRGETVKAVIVLREGVAATREQILDHCATLLTGYKIPRVIEFRPALPRTPVGKIDRLQLTATDFEGSTA